MTRFADELFDDLIREHGSTLAHTRVPVAPKRHPAARPLLLTAGAGGLAVAATVGTLVAGGGTPAYAVTTHPDGTVTLAVYQQSGISGVNAKLHQLGDRVVVVPVGSDCPSINSLRAPAVPAKQVSLEASTSGNGSVTVAAQGVPVGDILVVASETTTTTNGQVHASGSGQGQASASSSARTGTGPVHTSGGGAGHGVTFSLRSSKLTSGPAPSCVSISASPATGGPSGATAGGSGGPGTTTRGGGSTPTTWSNG
jgi:hypothetical protein